MVYPVFRVTPTRIQDSNPFPSLDKPFVVMGYCTTSAGFLQERVGSSREIFSCAPLLYKPLPLQHNSNGQPGVAKGK
jgi:hypothetical protein